MLTMGEPNKVSLTIKQLNVGLINTWQEFSP